MLLFLDFDGVLHGLSEVRFAHLPRLEGILRDHPPVEVVLTTSWREIQPIGRLRECFSDDLRHRVVGATPVITDRAPPYPPHRRYREVLLFLQTEGLEGRPWVALEDERRCYPLELPNVVLCDERRGMDDAVEARLRALLAEMRR